MGVCTGQYRLLGSYPCCSRVHCSGPGRGGSDCYQQLNMTIMWENSFREEVNMFTNNNTAVHNAAVQNKKKKKKRPPLQTMDTTFHDLYKLTGEILGEGSYGSVKTCKNIFTGVEYAAKIIEKIPGSFSRSKVLKEIEIYHLCRGHKNIVQLIEFFEETDKFVLVFEKVQGGSLLKYIQNRESFTEDEARTIIKDLAEAINHLHAKGVAHRDIKPDNVLCTNSNSTGAVKLCDFDLCSPISLNISTPTLLSPVGSLEYMAPEVADTFIVDDYYDDNEEDISYNKKCDLWSLGVIMYILLSGNPPFSGNCGLGCGWENGDDCGQCQELLMASIMEAEIQFSGQTWDLISTEAKDLIIRLLEKDSWHRFSSKQVLYHPWITNIMSGHRSYSPSHIQGNTNNKQLENFFVKALAINKSLEQEFALEQECSSLSMDIPEKGKTCSFNLSQTSHLYYKRKHRGSKEFFSKFSSIDEIESDFFMENL